MHSNLPKIISIQPHPVKVKVSKLESRIMKSVTLIVAVAILGLCSLSDGYNWRLSRVNPFVFTNILLQPGCNNTLGAELLIIENLCAKLHQLNAKNQAKLANNFYNCIAQEAGPANVNSAIQIRQKFV
jgi:hypothetical protein